MDSDDDDGGDDLMVKLTALESFDCQSCVCVLAALHVGSKKWLFVRRN